MEPPSQLREILTLISKSSKYGEQVATKAKLMLNNLEGKICRLEKSLYGLKQAGKGWHSKLDDMLKRCGAKPTQADLCLYWIDRNRNITLIAIYVDDILIFSKNTKTVEGIVRTMSNEFQLKDLGEAQYCLDAQNYKFIIKYHQLVEDTIYKDLLEYYIVVSNYRCPILQHIDGRIYCILCNATVNKHICIHIDSKAHQQSLSSTHMLQLLKRYHQIWAAQPIHVQIEQIYFRKREHKITCTVCSNYLSYDSAMLTQHVDSVDHKRFLMKATEIRTSSSNLLKQGPESVSSRSTSVETDRNASLSTSSSSSDIGNRIVANSTMADVPSPPTPNSPVSRNLSETATLIPYDETVLDDLYSDGLVHFIVTIGSTKYPTIIKREACKYCLLCNVDITTTVLLHANSPQHVEAMTVDRRCELLKKFHELWIRLPQTDQCRQVLFTIEEDLVCSLCNQKMSYDVDEVKSHLESWEHVQKLMVTRTNATVQEPTFSQAANNGTVPDSPRKIDDKISEETPKTPTEKVKLLQDLLSGFKFTSPSENKTNTTVTKNAERKFDNSSTKPAVPVNYSQETLDELYSEELIHYHVRIGNIRYPFIQNMGTYKRCLICNIDLINSILFHVNSPPHVAMLNNPKKMEQLKSYHDLWLNFSEPYQREQKYFEVGEKLSCSPCQKVLEYDVGALTAHIFSTGHGNKTWELNNQSSTGSGKVVNAQHKVKEKAPRSSDDLIDFNDPQPVTEKKPAVNESTASDLVTGLPPVHEKQLNAGDGNLKTVSACNESSDEGNSDPVDHTDNQEETMESQADQRGQDTAIHDYASSPPDMTDQGSTQDSGIDKSIIVAKKTYTSTKRKFSQNASTISNSADAAFIGWLKNKQERDSSKENPNTDKQNRQFRQKVIGLMDNILEDADIRVCHSSTSNVSSISSVYCPTPSPNNRLQCPMSHPDVPRPAWSVQEIHGNYSEYPNDFQRNEDIRYT
ncbi:hypothetical protein Trydic_g21286 [Trypoxylus dichotomus]